MVTKSSVLCSALVSIFLFASGFASAQSPASDTVSDHARDASNSLDTPPPKEVAAIKCPRYKVYYIDPSAQFFTPPVPIEDHAEFVFCSDHANLDEIRLKIKKMKPVRSHVDAESARIKVVLRGNADEAMTFCSTGEITYRGKQYRLDRRAYEPALLAIREEGDRQRALAIESEDDGRNPAGAKSSPRAKK